MATQYPTEQEQFCEEFRGVIKRLQEKYDELIAVQVIALKDIESKGILTKEQAEKVRKALGFKK